MPKILVTGNGFDLNYGFPTSYSDFINILNHIKMSHDLDFDIIYSKCSKHQEIINNFKSFIFDKEKIEILENEIKKNLWYNFFENEYQIETWIDFENKIEYVLKMLFSSLEYLKENRFFKGSIGVNDLSYDARLFNNNIEIIHVLKNFKIIYVDSDYNITLNESYLIKKYDFFINIDLDKITKNLYSELILFKKIFNYYFEIFIFPLYDNIKTKFDRTLFSTINKHYTFNYTPTFEKLFNNRNITSFLHGKIDSDINKIVLGINDIPDETLEKKYFIPFTKYFQKLDNNTDYIFIKEFEKKKNSNFMFFFLGHSLDKSDEDYINEIFEFVIELKSKIKKIVVIYHSEKSKSKLLINLLDIRGKKNIQELMKNNILVFIENNSRVLTRELKRDLTTSSMSTIIESGVY